MHLKRNARKFITEIYVKFANTKSVKSLQITSLKSQHEKTQCEVWKSGLKLYVTVVMREYVRK